MIKNMITPEIKKRFSEEIQISKEIGKERGFYLCIDQKGGLFPSKSCEGDVCDIHLGDSRKLCPGDIQGDFHTHPYLKEAEKELLSRKEKIPTEEVLTKRMDDNIRIMHQKRGIEDITINSPTYDDLLHTTLFNCYDITKGTICTASDIGKNKVECWTAKKINENKMDLYCNKTILEISKRKKETGFPLIEKWIDDIFDREVINL